MAELIKRKLQILRTMDTKALTNNLKEYTDNLGSGRDYWDDTAQIFFTGNRGWGVAPDLSTVCLGIEVEVISYLKGGSLPKHISPVVAEVLEDIKKLKENSEHEQGDRTIPEHRSYQSGARKVRNKRSRFMLDSRRRPASARRAKGTKKVPNRLP